MSSYFFNENDWYSCLVRELNQLEDNEKWKGIGVFTYKFKSKNETVIVRADKLAKGITSINTSLFSISAIPENQKPAYGFSTQIHWEIENKSDREMNLSIIANGNSNVKINYCKALVLAPKQKVIHSANVDVPIKKHNKTKNEKTAFVNSIITKEKINAVITIAAGTGLAIDRKEKKMTLCPNVKTGFSVLLSAEKKGVYNFPISIYVKQDDKFSYIPAIDKKVFGFATPAFSSS